jgi:hypothetical protein
MQAFLYKFTLGPNSVHLFWRSLLLEFLLGISHTSICSISAPHVEIVFLLDVRQLLMFLQGRSL